MKKVIVSKSVEFNPVSASHALKLSGPSNIKDTEINGKLTVWKIFTKSIKSRRKMTFSG